MMLFLSILAVTLLSGPATGAPAPDAARDCDDACHLLKLIRYREEVNTDWLMAVGFCSSLVRRPAEHYASVEPLTLFLASAADEPLTKTITETVTEATTRPTAGETITGRDYGH